ncbi:cystathionine gamma-synthase [Noviherbaspirillum aridicola]|uniref:Cystathionine gamma-synthase n=1 Tax=Noviherbaspirillum aridicola TaxID=2849687 RepID=A0ABQ4Q9K2_9BURK|nr:cystathionine gamma-synthase [Noviherbaspirillum aridicola]
MITLAALLMASVTSSAYAADVSVQDRAAQIWQLLDYMAVDYGGAVADGKVIDADEYAEMQEFAQTAERQLGELPDKAEKAGLLQLAAALKSKVEAKAGTADVAEQANRLAAGLLAAYPVPTKPAKTPDLKLGARLYQAQCASCHGAEGRGDGPAAAGMNPPPIAFTDRARARERSVFSLHQSITRGVEGTPMPSFAQLSDEDRWALAFFVSTQAFDKQEQEAGKSLWESDKRVQSAVPNIETLTQLSESGLEKTLQAKDAAAVLAHLRNHPEALAPSAEGSLSLARTRLQESLTALERGDRAEATRLALSAYLDGFEPVEPALAIKDKPLFTEIEQTMGAYRAAISQSDKDEARQIEARLQTLLTQAQDKLDVAQDDKFGVFLGALTILLREGVEALLVVVAMIAFLRKADRADTLRYVHAGWISALAAGGLTWFAATYLIEVSGASRELTEGFSAIFAAVVLLAVGIWMHQKSLAGRWQMYIRDKLTGALGKRTALMLFILAFVTVYREVFETVLFYAALWTEGSGAYLLAGLGLGIVILAVIAFLMLRTSARLPISQFFAVSSALVAVLAVVLIGKGVAALQEAGMLDITPIAAPSIDLLGIYPSLQTMLAQLLVLLVVAGSMALNYRMNGRDRGPTTPPASV